MTVDREPSTDDVPDDDGVHWWCWRCVYCHAPVTTWTFTATAAPPTGRCPGCYGDFGFAREEG